MRKRIISAFYALLFVTLLFSFQAVCFASDIPQKQTDVKATGYVNNGVAGIRFSWKGSAQVSGYEYTVRAEAINTDDVEDFSLTRSTSETFVEVPLENDYRIIFKLRSYRLSGSAASYSRWTRTVLKKSQVRALIQAALIPFRPGKPSEISVSGALRGGQAGLSFTWKGGNNADGYDVRYIAYGSGGRSLKDVTKEDSYFLAADIPSKVAFWVRARRSVAGRVVYSVWEKKVLSGSQVDALLSAASGQKPEQGQEQVLTEAELRSYAAKLPDNVLDAFVELGFTVKVVHGKDYDGWFNIKKRVIEIPSVEEIDTLYHEMGHFVAFASGNTDMTRRFRVIYNSEKNLYTWSKPQLAARNVSEYFAESVREYLENTNAFRQACPKTAKAIRAAMKKITPSQVDLLKRRFGL